MHGELVKFVGSDVHGNELCVVTVYNNEVYVYDNNNPCILVFDLDLYFVQSIDSHGKGGGELDLQHDV